MSHKCGGECYDCATEEITRLNAELAESRHESMTLKLQLDGICHTADSTTADLRAQVAKLTDQATIYLAAIHELEEQNKDLQSHLDAACGDLERLKQ